MQTLAEQPRFSPVKKRLETVEKPLQRADVLQALARVLDGAFARLENRYTTKPDRIAWSRVVVQACQAAGVVLRDSELSELLERVSALEEARSHEQNSD